MPIDELRSSNELGDPKFIVLTSCTTGGNGSVPSGICHWSVVPVDIILWNKFSESGQIKLKSRSDAACRVDCCVDCEVSHVVLVGGAGATVDGEFEFHAGSVSCIEAVWDDSGEGWGTFLVVGVRMCSFS